MINVDMVGWNYDGQDLVKFFADLPPDDELVILMDEALNTYGDGVTRYPMWAPVLGDAIPFAEAGFRALMICELGILGSPNAFPHYRVTKRET